MRKLFIVIIALLLLWMGYWYVGARAVEGGLSGWLDDRQEEGWVSEYTSVKTRGFPNRFHTTITDLELADPRSGVAWSAPAFEIYALAYKPNHIIAVWPKEQVIATPYEKISNANQKMIASVVFDAGTSLRLNRSSFELVDFSLTSSRGWTTKLEKGQFATRQTAGKENAHDIFFEATALQPSGSFLAVLDPANVLPDRFETLRLDMTVTFDAPWDRFAIERRRPQPVSVELKDLKGTWGKLDIQAAGELVVDGLGIPEGRIAIRATNWRDILKVAVDAGLVPVNISGTLENALELMAGLSGNPKTLDAPLVFKNGRMSFGPIPLGPAPRLKIR